MPDCGYKKPYRFEACKNSVNYGLIEPKARVISDLIRLLYRELQVANNMNESRMDVHRWREALYFKRNPDIHCLIPAEFL
jgi:hypothetical protein